MSTSKMGLRGVSLRRHLLACLDELFHAELRVVLQLVVTLMHTVSCVRTLSIGPRRLGPRLCMHRPRAAKVALRRPRSRERRCSARRRRATEHFAPSWRPFGGATAANAPRAAEKKGTPQPAPLGAVVGEHWRARSVLGTLPDGQNAKDRSLADFKPSDLHTNVTSG